MIHFMKTLFSEFYDKNEAVRDRLKVFTMAGTMKVLHCMTFSKPSFSYQKVFFVFFF